MDYLSFSNFFLLKLIALLLILIVVLFLLVKYFVEIKASIAKKRIKRWWFNSPDEEIFKKNIEIFLENYPIPLSKLILKKDQQVLRNIQLFLENDFLNKEKISLDLYVELISMLKEKQEILALDFFQVTN